MTAVMTGLTKPTGPRWMVAALLASVGLNLVILAALGVGLWRHASRAEAAGPPHLWANLLSYTETLPKVRRDELRSRTEEERRIVRPLRTQLREVREEALKLLAADEFDRQRFEAVQARLLIAD